MTSAKSKKKGRPSLYTDKLAAEICRRLAEGETLRSVCRDEAMEKTKCPPGGRLLPSNRQSGDRSAYFMRATAKLEPGVNAQNGRKSAD